MRANDQVFMNKNVTFTGFTTGTFKASLGGGVTASTYLTADSQAEIPIPDNMTFDHICFSCISNNIDEDTVIVLIINGVAGNQIMTLPANSGAVVIQDITNNDPVVRQDLVNYQLVNASTGGSCNRPSFSMMGRR